MYSVIPVSVTSLWKAFSERIKREVTLSFYARVLYQLTNLSGGMECFLSFKNCALRLKMVPVCLAQLLRCQSVAMHASRLPFALNLTKTTSAIPPDRLVHWY